MTVPAILVLAGGRGTRMGSINKGLMPFHGRPLLERVLRRLEGQGGPILLSANDSNAEFARYSLPIIGDSIAGSRGPLAGIEAGMAWLERERPDCTQLVTVPVDCPNLPLDLVAALVGRYEATGAEIVFAASGERTHYAAALWPVGLRNELHRIVEQGRDLSVKALTASRRTEICAFEVADVDPFFNINTPVELRLAEAALPELFAPLQ